MDPRKISTPGSCMERADLMLRRGRGGQCVAGSDPIRFHFEYTLMSLNFSIIDLRPEAVRLGDVSPHVLPSLAKYRADP